MKLFTHSLLMIGISMILSMPFSNAFAAGKVTICHIPPGNPSNAHTITVSSSAIPAHMAHGDAMGECSSGESSGTTVASLASATFVICDDREGEIGRTINISQVGRLQTNRFQCD